MFLNPSLNLRSLSHGSSFKKRREASNVANKENGHAQVALCYTLGDAYTLDYWKDMAKKIEDMGAKSLCIKDMAGLLVPAKATELVQALKESCIMVIS